MKTFCSWLSAFILVSFLTALSSTSVSAASATPAWVNVAGGVGGENATSTTVDTNGNVYVGGWYGIVGNDADLDPSAGEDIHSTAGDQSGYVSKYAADGSYIWSKVIDSDANATVLDVAVNAVANRIYVVGSFAGNADFDPSAGTQNGSSVLEDGYFLVLDGDGNYITHKIYSAEGNDYITNVEVNSNDEILLAGDVSGANGIDTTINLNPDGTEEYINTAQTQTNDTFIIKYNSALTFQWARVIQADAEQAIAGLTIGNDNAMYVTGGWEGSDVDFNGGAGQDLHTAVGGTDMFVSKYANNGDYVWTETIGSTDDEETYKIATDSDGNAYVVGEFYFDGMDFDPGAGEDVQRADGDGNGAAFLTKLTSAGEYVWTRSWDGGDYDAAMAVTVNDNDQVVVAGYTGSPSIDLDPSEGETIVEPQNFAYLLTLSMFNSAGDFEFGYLLGNGGDDAYFSMMTSASSRLYIAGQLNGVNGDFDGTEGELLKSSEGDSDSVLAVYSLESDEGEDQDGEGDSGQNSGSSSNPIVNFFSEAKAPTCADQTPGSAPELFQIDSENGSATLYFSPATGSVNSYNISYGFIPGVYLFGTTMDSSQNSGVQQITINHLLPYVTYNFKVMAVNGCAPGPWSKDLSVKMLKTGNQSSYLYN